MRPLALTPIVLLFAVACGSEIESRGGPGESCTKRADCGENLGCFASVCGTSLEAVQAEREVAKPGPENSVEPPADAQAAAPTDASAPAEASGQERRGAGVNEGRRHV